MTKRATRKELLEMLWTYYEREGPRARGLKVVAPPTYAALTTAEIDATWDFDRRHEMHRVARALAAEAA